MIVIGEKINGSIPSVAKAIAERDAELIKERAIAQDKAGATFIDCCASVEEDVEVETMKWMIDCIQEVSDKPIAIDSPSPKVLAEVIKAGYCNKPGLVNSVSGEGDKVQILFPLIADTEWEVCALLCDDTGIPKNAGDRLRVFDNIMAEANKYGIDASRIHIDPLVEMLCTSEDGIAMVEEVMAKIREQYPTIHITGAVSNISFNLPYRKILNQSFTIVSMMDGFDSAIFDPLNKGLMGMIAAAEAIMAAGEVTADMDLDAIAAKLPDDQKKYLYPAYATMAMKEGILVPEYDEEYEEYDMDTFLEGLEDKVDPEFGMRDFTGLMYATNAMLGNDDMCMAYVGAFRDDAFGPQK